MTEAELFEAGQFAYSNSLAAFAIYITLLSPPFNTALPIYLPENFAGV
jgi:hypothetical protein